jgi:polysaccharide biosynthesis/export protein
MRKYLFLILLTTLCSCRINPSIMFRTGKDYPYKVDQTIGNVEYRIAANDILGFSVFTNDGFKLIDLTTGIGGQNAGSIGLNTNSVNNATKFQVDVEGQVKLPIIGKVKIADLTIREAEKLLEDKYTVYYNKPFVMLSVLNRRVMVFPGTGGAGTVVTLENENTTLIEALAMAGGITESGKANTIKLIRGDTRNPQVHLIDLSTVEGMKQSNMLLQANDIIYVEPVRRVSRGILAEITPVVGIITSLLLLYEIVINKGSN